ncbi:PH domain-containing protein [Jiangella aurantiaca]|uniref:PH domain-containing protein n=1 Tax=Jiangella aurantiaca TaxID=2530373 RepID=UPI0013A5EE30|nr:PH domain-containing protein [Jiangella aurantiaca]
MTNAVVLRHSLGRAVAVAGWLAALGWLVASWPPDGRGLLFAAAASGLLWVVCWRPAVVIDDAAVTVRNPLRDVRIGWSALDEAGFGWSLQLRAGELSCRAVAAPGPASMSALYDRHVTPGGVLERDAVMRAGQRPAPALLAVRQRWEARRSQPSGGVVVPAVANMAVLAASLVLLVTAAVLA